jgi:hypothetical protein
MKQPARPFVVEIKRSQRFSAKVGDGLRNPSNGRIDRRNQGERVDGSPPLKGESLLPSRETLRLPPHREKRAADD